jgi:hypothetical protein
VMFVCGGDCLTEGATLGGGASDEAVVVGASLTSGGAYARDEVVVGAVVGGSTTVAEGEAGAETAIGGATGREEMIGAADVAVGGFFSSRAGASAGAPRGYQRASPTMTAVAATTAVIASPRTDTYSRHLRCRLSTR